VPYAGIPTFRVLYHLLAAVRDKQGVYQEIWFPKSGEVIFRAHYHEMRREDPWLEPWGVVT
jgi:hypothetical protein